MFNTKADVKNEIMKRGGTPFEIPFSMLKFPFGFKRIDGKDFMLQKLLIPNLTEEQACYSEPNEIKEKIELWCLEEKIFYRYDRHNDSYLFSSNVQ